MARLTSFGILLTSWVVWVSAVAGQTPTPTATPVLVENFDGNTINPSLWTAFVGGTGSTIMQTNQRLEIAIDRTSTEDPSRGFLGAGYSSAGALRGDFDIQVDYTLLNWPNVSGIRIGIFVGVFSTTTPTASTGRVSCGKGDCGGENYFTGFYVTPGARVRFVPTTDRSGTLRLAKSGNTFTGYYRNGDSWVAIDSVTGAVFGDAPFGLAAWSHNRLFTNEDVKVAFDNFIVNQGELLLGAQHCTGDRNLDGKVSIDETIDTVNNALNGCPVPTPPVSAP